MPKAIRSFAARPYLLFFAVFVTVTALLLGTTDSFSASSLKLISPNGGQSYAVGSSVNIKWAKGNGGSEVKVTLLKGGKGYLNDSITYKSFRVLPGPPNQNPARSDKVRRLLNL